MKSLLLILMLSLSACGSASSKNEAVGQVKKVVNETPLICPNYQKVDISLGVMMNGVGSMSHEDIWFYIDDKQDMERLVQANQTGKLVKIEYEVRRLTFCVPNHWITKVEVMQ